MFESELRPFLARHYELALLSQKRKISGLQEAVVAALERRLQIRSEAVSDKSTTLLEEATEALRNGERTLEQAQSESFFLTRKIGKMHRAIIDIAAQRIAAALTDQDNIHPASIFSDTLTRILAEPVAATLSSIEQTSMHCATRLLRLRTCTARTLKLRPPVRSWLIHQLPKMIFGFCANGTRPTSRLRLAAYELPVRGLLLQIGNCEYSS